MLIFLLQALIVVALPYGLWRLRLLRSVLPLVVVQIAVGLAFGPTVLGRLSPDMFASLFPTASLDRLQGLVWLSLLFFAFLTGLHFDLAEMKDRSCGFIVSRLGSLILPVAAGAVAGGWLLPGLPDAAGARATPTTFAVGMGVAAGVTALPVLGAILREMGMTRSRVGVLALGCAAVNDALLWVLAAALLAFAGGGSFSHGLVTLGWLLLFIALLLLVVRPLCRGLLASAVEAGQVSPRELVALCALMLLSALATEALGVHAMVGAFAFGTILPREVAEDLTGRFESFVSFVLMPFFFMSTGLATFVDWSAGGGEGMLELFAVMTAVGFFGKMVATTLPLRYCGGLPWSEALTAGAFMQCKGLMEIVVLTMLRDGGIISSGCFSAMICGTLLTTALTKPLVMLFTRRSALA